MTFDPGGSSGKKPREWDKQARGLARNIGKMSILLGVLLVMFGADLYLGASLFQGIAKESGLNGSMAQKYIPWVMSAGTTALQYGLYETISTRKLKTMSKYRQYLFGTGIFISLLDTGTDMAGLTWLIEGDNEHHMGLFMTNASPAGKFGVFLVGVICFLHEMLIHGILTAAVKQGREADEAPFNWLFFQFADNIQKFYGLTERVVKSVGLLALSAIGFVLIYNYGTAMANANHATFFTHSLPGNVARLGVAGLIVMTPYIFTHMVKSGDVAKLRLVRTFEDIQSSLVVLLVLAGALAAPLTAVGGFTAYLYGLGETGGFRIMPPDGQSTTAWQLTAALIAMTTLFGPQISEFIDELPNGGRKPKAPKGFG